MIRGKRILITGGAGFIGTSLALRLVDDNDIVIYDNLHRNAMKDTLLVDHPRMTFIQGDVLDSDALDEAAKGCQVLFETVSSNRDQR